MAGLFRKIAKGLLIGGGTVLSLFAPAIGAPLLVAGTNIQTDKDKSLDKLSGYATNLESAKNQAAAMSAAGSLVSVPIMDRIKANPIPWIIGAVGLLFVAKKMKIF